MLSQYTITIPQCFHGQMYQKITADSSPIPASSDKTHLMNGLVSSHASPPAGELETREPEEGRVACDRSVIIIKTIYAEWLYWGEKQC